MTPLAAYAKEAGGTWHMLPELGDGVESPAACGATGPWSSVATLAPAADKPRCAPCWRTVAP